LPELAARAQKRIAEGGPLRRAMALILYRSADQKAGRAAVLELIDRNDGQVPEALRCAAVELAMQFGDLDEAAAVGYLNDADAHVRAAAAAHVAGEITPFRQTVVTYVGDEPVYPYYFFGYPGVSVRFGDQEEALPTVPEDFPVEKLVRAAEEAGGDLDSVARYLRARGGDDAAMKGLVEEARENTYDNEAAYAVALAVIARGNDDEIKYVQDVYGKMESYGRSSFAARTFSAFNAMRGPNALKLRRELLRERRKAGAGW
jgi:hypothetical protein